VVSTGTEFSRARYGLTRVDRATTWLVAICFALFLNAGVVHYVQRYLLGINPVGAWPVLIASVVSVLATMFWRGLSIKFIRVAMAWAMLSVMYAATYLYSRSGEYGFDKALLTIFIPSVCVAAGFVLSRDGRLRTSLAWCGVLAVLAAIAFTMNNHTPEMFAQTDRIGSGIAYHPVIITYHNFAFVMALGAIWAVDRFSVRLPRVDVLAGLSFLVFSYFIVISGARIGILVVGVTLLLYFLTGALSRSVRMIVIGVILIGGVLGTALMDHYAVELATGRDVPATIQRLVTYAFLQPKLNILSPREVFRTLALDVFWSAPLAGVGWGGFAISAGLPDVSGYWPHNLVLELLAETGMLGALAFMIFQVWILYEFLTSRGSGPEKRLILALFSAGFAASMVGGDLPNGRILFFAIGAMAGFPNRRDRNPKLLSGK
jgi:O-antigen ligase